MLKRMTRGKRPARSAKAVALQQNAKTGWSAKALAERIGAEIVRFQEASYAVDEVAAAILGLDRRDLPTMTLLLFGGPATAQHLADALRRRGLSAV